MPGRIHRYVGLLGVAAAVAVALLVSLAGPGTFDPLTTALLVAVIAVAERTQVVFVWARTPAGFTLTETAIAAGLLLTTPLDVVLTVVPGVALAHLVARRPFVKIAYNTAITTLGAALAGVAVVLWPALGPTVDGRPVLGVLVGLVAYGTVSALAFAGLLTQLQDRRTFETLRGQLPMHVASTLGNTSVGIVLAALSLLEPTLTPFVAALAVSVHVALRSSVRANAALETRRAEHDRLVRVVDGASDGIVLLAADGSVQVWNPAMTALTGLTASDVVGRPAAASLTAQVRRAAQPVTGRWSLDEATPRAPRRDVDARLVGPDGTVRDVRESHAFTFDDRGRCDGAVVVVHDVSRQRELERLRSDFVARVSHELRTPLTPIRGFASVLLRRGEVLAREEREEALTRIVERADHLHTLVEDLLLVTRLEHDDVAELVHPVACDLAAVARAAVDEATLGTSGRTITCVAPDDAPAALADPGRTRQILLALLDNAARYTPDDTPVEVEVVAAEDDVHVRVVDHGPGIAVADREAVFAQFHRLEDPLTMRTGGVGVGLFIARRLALAMGGDLTLEDPIHPHGGATFDLRLPRAVPRAAHTPSGSPGSRVP